MSKEENVTAGLVAFIDVLGFGITVSLAESMKDVRKCAAHVNRIREAFDFQTSDETTLAIDEMYGKRSLAFSDSIVVHIPFASQATEYEGDFDPILMQLSNFALAQGRCVLNGTFLRAGIDFNWWYEEGSVLVSQGLVCSYSLESKANVPVFALTDALYAHFSEHAHRNFYAESIEPVSQMFRKYSGPDSNGDPIEYWYLDYLTSCLDAAMDDLSLAERDEELAAGQDWDKRDEIANARRARKLRRFAAEHATVIKNAYAVAPAKARSKYEWLAEYHNEIVGQWTELDAEVHCDLK